MTIIDTENYRFTTWVHPIDRAKGVEPETFTFKPLELAEYLSLDLDKRGFAQHHIEKMLAADTQYIAHKRSRKRLAEIPNFRAYRKVNRYANDAVLQIIEHGVSEQKFKLMISGLIGEIEDSPIQISQGQLLFYGAGCTEAPAKGAAIAVPYFLSTTLSMTVAINHALRKSAGPLPELKIVRNPTVFGIRLQRSFPAIFAPSGKPEEHELLFGCGAQLNIQEVHQWSGGKFLYVEADLDAFDPHQRLTP